MESLASLELIDCIKLAGRGVLGICLSSPPRDWDYKQMLARLAFQRSVQGSNSSSHVCVASTLATELAPPHLHLYLSSHLAPSDITAIASEIKGVSNIKSDCLVEKANF